MRDLFANSLVFSLIFSVVTGALVTGAAIWVVDAGLGSTFGLPDLPAATVMTLFASIMTMYIIVEYLRETS